MKRLSFVPLFALAMLVILSNSASAQSKPEFKLGFKALADQIPSVVGEPIENEHWGANGDSLQTTTTGLMVWRKADNWTAFTNGARTWLNGPFGVQDRANLERFDWEAVTPVAPQPVTAAPAPAPAPVPAPTQASAPSQAPAQVQTLRTLASGYGQDGIEMAFAFVIENPNPGHMLDGKYQVAAYDSSGRVLDTDSGYITYVLPGQKTAIAASMYLPDNTTAAKLDVQVQTTSSKAFTARPSFSFSNITYLADRWTPKVSATISSPFDKDGKYVRISAVAYNASGVIVGGGFTFQDFVPARGQSATSFSVTTNGTPARIELYASISSLGGTPW